MIHFKSTGKGNGFHNHLRSWLALGDHGVHPDGTHLLSAECVTIGELEEEADILHKQIDKAVSEARRKFNAARA